MGYAPQINHPLPPIYVRVCVCVCALTPAQNSLSTYLQHLPCVFVSWPPFRMDRTVPRGSDSTFAQSSSKYEMILVIIAYNKSSKTLFNKLAVEKAWIHHLFFCVAIFSRWKNNLEVSIRKRNAIERDSGGWTKGLVSSAVYHLLLTLAISRQQLYTCAYIQVLTMLLQTINTKKQIFCS